MVDISVSTVSEKSRCLLATGFPFRNYELLDEYLQIFKSFMTQVSHVVLSPPLWICAYCGRYEDSGNLIEKPWILREAH